MSGARVWAGLRTTSTNHGKRDTRNGESKNGNGVRDVRSTTRTKNGRGEILYVQRKVCLSTVMKEKRLRERFEGLVERRCERFRVRFQRNRCGGWKC